MADNAAGPEKATNVDQEEESTQADAADSEGKDRTDGESAPTSSSRGFVGTKDRWGFLNSDEFHQFLKLPEDVERQRKEKEGERTKKWIKMKKNWQKYALTGAKYGKMKRRTRKGVPDAVRGFAWYEVCGAATIKQKIPDPWKIDTSVVSAITIDEVRGPLAQQSSPLLRPRTVPLLLFNTNRMMMRCPSSFCCRSAET
jgi:hypothetical protein